MNIDNANFIDDRWDTGSDGNSFFTTSTMSPTKMSSFQDTTTNNNDDEIIVEVIDHLSDTQVKILSLLFVFSGTLSILGSSTIVTKVLKNRSKATPYDRLMLGLSSCDIVASLSWVLTPFLLPEDTSVRVWARGTDTSCTILGTLTQFGYAAIFYNLILSVYYLLTVRFGIKRQVFAQRYEPFMHTFGIVYFLGTAITGGVLGVYSEVDIGLGCWVNDYPDGCDRTTCISGKIAWAFGSGPLLFAFLALIAINTIIYFHVKNKLGNGTQDYFATLLKPEGLTSAQARQVPTQQQLDRVRQHQRHIREVATQGSLYVLTFFCAYTPSQILRAMEAYAEFPISESPMFPLFVFNSILLPLQGFFNMFVYTRPNYTRLRVAYPELSAFWAIRKACWDPNIPRLTEASKISSRSGIRQVSANGIGGGNSGSGGGGLVGSGGLGIGGGSYHSAHRGRGSRCSSSGRAFSSELDVLEEASEENWSSSEDTLGSRNFQFQTNNDNDDGDGQQEQDGNNAIETDENGNDKGRQGNTNANYPLNNNYSASSCDFDLSEEYKKVFDDSSRYNNNNKKKKKKNSTANNIANNFDTLDDDNNNNDGGGDSNTGDNNGIDEDDDDDNNSTTGEAPDSPPPTIGKPRRSSSFRISYDGSVQ